MLFVLLYGVAATHAFSSSVAESAPISPYMSFAMALTSSSLYNIFICFWWSKPDMFSSGGLALASGSLVEVIEKTRPSPMASVKRLKISIFVFFRTISRFPPLAAEASQLSLRVLHGNTSLPCILRIYIRLHHNF